MFKFSKPFSSFKNAFNIVECYNQRKDYSLKKEWSKALHDPGFLFIWICMIASYIYLFKLLFTKL